MKPERYQEVRRIFEAALHREQPMRAAFLDEACSGDDALRQVVESLLLHHEEHDSLFANAGGRLEARLMRAAAGGATSERVGDSPLPQVDARSVMLTLAGAELKGVGIRLNDLDDEPPLPELHTGADKYQILGVLGEGGMGKVYLAHDQDLMRRVALKVVRQSRSNMLRRFVEEAQVMGQLQHPNIVPIHDLGLTAGGKIYYTMPVVRGRTLAAILDDLRAGKPDVARKHSLVRLVQIFVQVSQAVGYAHAKGVIHRDLKPSNVMLGEHGEVQVLDWGLSKVLARAQVATERATSLTETGVVMGTPAYMAPEQAAGGAVDWRTDIYALGVLLYEMLCLRPPLEGDTTQILEALRSQIPVAPRARAPGRQISLELEETCLKALRNTPEARQQSTDELCTEVQRWLETALDRTKRHERAEARAAEGRDLLERYRWLLKHEVARLEDYEKAVAERFQGWQPAEEKTEILEARRQTEQAHDELTRVSSQVISKLTEALGHDRQEPATARLLWSIMPPQRRVQRKSSGWSSEVVDGRRIRHAERLPAWTLRPSSSPDLSFCNTVC